VSTLLPDVDVRVVVARTTGLSRHARQLAGLLPASAALLAQGLTGGALMGSLQKEHARINVQLECDGPVRGFFIDADNQGSIRGYVKNRYVEYVGAEGVFHWRPVLGNKGFVSVLRDLGGGEYYRSSVELRHFDFAKDLENYFKISEQVRTHLAVALVPEGSEGLGAVAGVLIQTLPKGHEDVFEALGRRLHAERMLEKALAANPQAAPMALVKELAGEHRFEVMSRYPLAYSCTCSKDRVLTALVAMGREELEDMLAKEGKAEVSCQFCTTQYVITGPEIREILQHALS
jgi:molecular chaperone Hsp33